MPPQRPRAPAMEVIEVREALNRLKLILSETIGSPFTDTYLVTINDRTVALKQSGSYEGIDLSGVDLHRAHLENVNLKRAKLVGANLWGAYLAGANLEGADLKDAVLTGADLSGAVLIGADLTGARIDSNALSDARR